MNFSTPTSAGFRDRTICCLTDRMNIAKFFFLNYGLHVLTIITEPGNTGFIDFSRSIFEVYFPITNILSQYAGGGKDPLTILDF